MKAYLLLVALCICSAVAQAPTGSDADKEYLYESPLKFSSGIGGFTMILFESVNNVNQGSNWGSYRFYQAPLGAFLLPKQLQADDLKNGFFRYSVKMIAYHDIMEHNACKSVMEMYKQKSGGALTCEVGSGMISRMTHRLVTIEFPDFPQVQASHFCSMIDECTFNDVQQVSIVVPNSDKNRFEDYYMNGKLLVNINLFYKAKDVGVSSISWTASDIQNTSSYKNVVSGGSNFVSASQVQSIMMEAATSKQVTIFQDPSVPDKLNQMAYDIFTKYLFIEGMNTDFIASRNQANAVDQQLLAGTGFTAQQFAPITIMWDVVEQVANSTSWSDANNLIKQYFTEETNREKLEGSCSVGFGPFGASMGYSKEMTSDKVNSGYFQNQNEYTDFKSYFSNSHGMQPRITPRGLQLVEKETFMSNLQNMASSIVYFPMNVVRQVQLMSGVVDPSEIHDIPPPPVPVPPKTLLVEYGSELHLSFTPNKWQMIPDLFIDFEVKDPEMTILMTSSLRYTTSVAVDVTHSIHITKDGGEAFYGDCGSWSNTRFVVDSCAITTKINSPGKYRAYVAVYPTSPVDLDVAYHRHLAIIQE